MNLVSIVSTEGEPRKSSLSLEPNGVVRVIGVLPHNFAFRPENLADASKLAAHLTDGWEGWEHPMQGRLSE
jgi:hypothetical protein